MAGHCVVCGVVGEDEESRFLCEGCVDLERVLVVCGGCGMRCEGTPAVLEVVHRFTPLRVPCRGGVTVKLSSCFKCGEADEPMRIQVFGV
jgi:hypothetical protein